MARSSSSQNCDLVDLKQMFSKTPGDIVSDVFEQVGKDKSKAIEKLLQMSDDQESRSRHPGKGRESVRKADAGKSPKASKDDEGHRIRSKYPSRVPIICQPPDDVSTKPCKLLVPASMTCTEFIKIAREKCAWATDECEPFVNGKRLPDTPSMQELDAKYKSADGFLYVNICTKPPVVAQSSSPEAAAATQSGDSKQQPSVFHMPDADPMSAESSQVKRVLRKYPDRVPVLFKQSPVSGLPAVDKKLLVPHIMQCHELKEVLKKHTPICEEVDWGSLCIVVAGNERLKDNMCIKEVYDDHKDSDGCLHISLADSKSTADIDLRTDLADNDEPSLHTGVEKESLVADLESAKERADSAEEALKQEAEKAEHWQVKYLQAEEKKVELEEVAEAAKATAAEQAQREAEKSLEMAGFLREAEEQRDSEARKVEEISSKMKEVENKASEEAERAQAAVQEAEQKALSESEKAADLEARLKKLQEQLASERSAARAAASAFETKLKDTEMQLSHSKDELKNVTKRAEAAEKRNKDVDAKIAWEQEATKEAIKRAERAEEARKVTAQELEDLKARARTNTEDVAGFEMVGSATNVAEVVEDWALM